MSEDKWSGVFNHGEEKNNLTEDGDCQIPGGSVGPVFGAYLTRYTCRLNVVLGGSGNCDSSKLCPFYSSNQEDIDTPLQS